jgi:hypothetical protein
MPFLGCLLCGRSGDWWKSLGISGIPQDSPVCPGNRHSLVATCTNLLSKIVASRVEMRSLFEMGFKGHIFRVLSRFDFYGSRLEILKVFTALDNIPCSLRSFFS